MLWDKCLRDRDLYVELWPRERRRFLDTTELTPKNNENSTSFRLLGNAQFQRKDIEAALALYNTSLCVAENGSAQLALAYANRSICFFQMKLYSNCLRDISLAKKANPPESLIAKLEQRRIKCNARLLAINKNNVEGNNAGPELSFPANEKIPGMADCFRVEKDVNYGVRIVATKDLEIGQNILIEEPCVRHICDGPVRRCYYCYKEYMNLMPCKTCTKGMFCSEACMATNCEANQCRVCMDECLTETFRSVLLALEAYPDVEDLMKATEEIRLRSQLWDEVQDYMRSPSPRTIYRLFFSRGVKNTYMLKGLTAKNIQDQILHYNQIMKNPRMLRKFSSLVSQRFLQHLILHHILVIKGCKGIFGLYEDDKLPPTAPLSDYLSHLYAVAHYPISNMFNHSCIPNVFLISSDCKVVLKTVQAVKSGEELFVPYL